MNLKPPTPRGGLHRTLRVLSLLLLQHALVPTGPEANARSRLPENPEGEPATDANSRPYLKVAGSLPLRFSAAPRPMTDFPIKVAAVSPPVQPIAAVSTEAPPLPMPLNPSSETNSISNDQTNAPAAPVSNRPALSILPDNTQPSTRPEDFLPYFQFPTGGNTTVVVPGSVARPPTSNSMPASSATYEQR